jgi:zinc protease
MHAQLFMLGGIRAETPSTNGVTSLLAQHLGTATTRLSKAKLQSLIEGCGANLGGSAGNNTLGLALSCLSRDFKRLFPVFADALLSPHFSEEEHALILRNQRKRIAKRVDDWQTYGGYHFRKQFFGDHPYGMSLTGELHSLKTLHVSDVQTHLMRHLTPASMVLVLCGDFDSEKILPEVENHFAAIPARSVEAIIHPRVFHQMPNRVEMPIIQDVCGIFMGFDGLTFSEASDRLSLDVMTSAFSGIHYPSGRLHTSLREKGLVYMVHATHVAGLEPGAFTICALTSPAQKEDALSAIHAEIQALQKEWVDHDEFEQAMAQLQFYYKEQLTSLSGLAVTSALDELYGLGYDYAFLVESQLARFSAADIQAEAQKRLINPQTLVVIGGAS